MNLSYTLLIFGGPVLAILSFVACLVPNLRPLRLARTVGTTAILFSFPVLGSYMSNTGYPMLILRPCMVFLGLMVSISYLVVSRRLDLPSRQSIAAVVLLVASVWDGATLAIMMAPGFGGEFCGNFSEIEDVTAREVATDRGAGWAFHPPWVVSAYNIDMIQREDGVHNLTVENGNGF